jgi:hypothetical protein
MKRKLRFEFLLCPDERQALRRLAMFEGGLSQAATLRRLIQKAAQERGLWPPKQRQTDQQVSGVAK